MLTPAQEVALFAVMMITGAVLGLVLAALEIRWAL
jgi:hypothetical protein